MLSAESRKLNVEQNGTKWNGVEWSGMLKNQKQVSLLLSVLVQTKLHSVWQSFPNSHNTRDFPITIIKQSINYKYNAYPQRALNIPMLSATARKTLPLSCQSKQNKQSTKEWRKIIKYEWRPTNLTSWSDDVTMWHGPFTKWHHMAGQWQWRFLTVTTE